MIRRPTPVTAIAWILIVFGIFGLLLTSKNMIWPSASRIERMASSPVPIPVQYAILAAADFLSLLMAYLLLGGKSSGRWLYAIVEPLRFVYALIQGSTTMMILPGLLMFAVIIYFLFRKDANIFFAAGSANAALQPKPTARRVLSTVCYCVAGFFFTVLIFMGFFTGATSAKMLMGAVFLLPGLVMLSIARLISPGPKWTYELGVAFLWSAIVGACISLVMVVCTMSPQFQESAAAKKHPHPFGDYMTGGSWTLGMLAIGAILLLIARRRENKSRLATRPRRSKRR
jgi:hypothetical protein